MGNPHRTIIYISKESEDRLYKRNFDKWFWDCAYREDAVTELIDKFNSVTYSINEIESRGLSIDNNDKYWEYLLGLQKEIADELFNRGLKVNGSRYMSGINNKRCNVIRID